MALILTTDNTLLGAWAPKDRAARLISGLATVVLGTAFIALCSRINVPTWPISVTLQTMAVAMIAAAFGWRIGLATVVLYIAEGLAGLPVFAVGAGPLYALSPAFGFILGFIPMALIIGRGADAGLSRKWLPLLAMTILGDAVCFLVGFTWLATYLVSASHLGLADALAIAFTKGVQPFLLWDVVKMAFAAVSVAGAWKLRRAN